MASVLYGSGANDKLRMKKAVSFWPDILEIVERVYF